MSTVQGGEKNSTKRDTIRTNGDKPLWPGGQRTDEHYTQMAHVRGNEGMSLNNATWRWFADPEMVVIRLHRLLTAYHGDTRW